MVVSHRQLCAMYNLGFPIMFLMSPPNFRVEASSSINQLEASGSINQIEASSSSINQQDGLWSPAFRV